MSFDDNDVEFNPLSSKDCKCDPESCSPTTAGIAVSQKNSKIKTLLFVFILLAAFAVTAYSLSEKSLSTQPTDGQSASALTLLQMQPQDNNKSTCGATLNSIRALEMASENKEAIFVLLPHKNDEKNQPIAQLVNSVVKKLNDKGKKVKAYTLNKDAAGFDKFAKEKSVESFPCVLVLGSGCNPPGLSKEITEEKLLAAYVKTTLPPSECKTDEGSDC